MPENQSFKYYAFISYSHKDQKIAKKLHKHLEHYHLPSALRKSNPNLPKKLSPVFIDESDLVARGTLWTGIQANLDRSNYIILICSPSSAKSQYVNDEVKYFIDSGRINHIIPLIVEGVPHSGDPDTECFPPTILALPREQELLGIDLQKFRMHEAFIRVIATLLKLDIDDFIARNARERKRKRIIFASFAAAVLIIVRLLMPPPYDEFLAENVMDRALIAYSSAGSQYERLRALADTAADNPSDFSQYFRSYKRTQAYLSSSTESNVSLQYLSDMMETGEVIPWSREPMSRQECEELLTLPDKRGEEYGKLADVLEFVMTDDWAKRYYGSRYIELLRGLLEIDAGISATLYEIVCSPHIAGKYDDESAKARQYTSNFSSHPKQNEHLNGENVQQAKVTLASLRGKRDEQIRAMDSCGVFEAYNQKNQSEE
ncbi:MAG: toll/interleukin-1 receptor domain-containing protein [Synergistaceae bacterium]|nr:toll/interleukin-1 receptor domain-containing protein [Synergistaceae bacterium]